MKKFLYSSFVALLFLGSTQAHAVDGCKVLLCLAGDWSNISECRPVVQEAMRDVARGHGWPTCSMSGAGNSASYRYITPSDCPVFYQQWGLEGDAGNPVYVGCGGYGALIKVQVNGAAWLDMFWSFGGLPSSTRYYPPARAALGANIDPKYDNDAAAYEPPQAPVPDQGSNGS